MPQLFLINISSAVFGHCCAHIAFGIMDAVAVKPRMQQPEMMPTTHAEQATFVCLASMLAFVAIQSQDTTMMMLMSILVMVSFLFKSYLGDRRFSGMMNQMHAYQMESVRVSLERQAPHGDGDKEAGV